MNIEVGVEDIGFNYKGWTIQPYEDWISKEDQTDVIWWGAEKGCITGSIWKKRTSLKDLIQSIDELEG